MNTQTNDKVSRSPRSAAVSKQPIDPDDVFDVVHDILHEIEPHNHDRDMLIDAAGPLSPPPGSSRARRHFSIDPAAAEEPDGPVRPNPRPANTSAGS